MADYTERFNAEVPKQRVRAMAQGASFGGADEIEARATSLLTGRPYDEVLAEIREKLKAYQKAEPIKSALYEGGGAILPALAAAPFTGGGSIPATALRMGLLGAAEGGAYAFGTGEGGAKERLSRVPGGAAVGSVGGVVGGKVAQAGVSAVEALVDATRRIVGRRGSSIVENEIQRLAEQTGRTVDEIAQDIFDGKILAENQTIRAAVKAIRGKGGPAAGIITDTLNRRPEQTRVEAMGALQRNLTEGGQGASVLAERRASEALTKKAENQAYEPFKTQPVSPTVFAELAGTLQKVPKAGAELLEQFQARTGTTPLFREVEGEVQFARLPTVEEAEQVRRAVGNRASSLYRGGQGGAGEAVDQAQKDLRNVLDVEVPELMTARAQAKAVRDERDSFTAGRKALQGDVYERMLELGDLAADPNKIAAYRTGFLSLLQGRAATNARASMLRNLANPESKENMILRALVPEDKIDAVIKRLETATDSQNTADVVLKNTQTAETMMAGKREGSGLSAVDMLGVARGEVGSIMQVGSKFADMFARELSDAERARVARILVSENPDLVRRALQDDGGVAALQDWISQNKGRVTRGASRASTVTAAGPAANYSAPLTQGLLSGPR